MIADIEEKGVGKVLVIEDVVVFRQGEETLLDFIDKAVLLLLVALLVSFVPTED